MTDATAESSGDGAASVLSVSDLRFAYAGRPRFEIAIRSFEVRARERLFLLGPSGSGKSTLLSLVCGIATPDAGRVEVLAQPFSELSNTARDRVRAEHFGVIFQMFNLLPYATAVDNVVLPLRFAPRRRSRIDGGAGEEARRLMIELGLPAEVLGKARASSLSVGQQQRVAVARALIGAPEIIIADEPTSALDTDAQDAFLALLFAQVGAAGASLIMVSHDERLAPRFDRVVRLPDIAEIRRGETA